MTTTFLPRSKFTAGNPTLGDRLAQLDADRILLLTELGEGVRRKVHDDENEKNSMYSHRY